MKRIKLHILWQDGDYVAVNKPPGLAAIPGRGEEFCVVDLLAEQLGLPATGPADPRIRVVHRIDKPTSGVLILALNLPAQRNASHQFQNNQAAKEYLALVAGRPSERAGVIDAPLGRHPSNPQEMTVLRHGGRPARTEWAVQTQFRDFALFRVFPRTGKTHQIRVHLRHVGLPLAIDPLYNPPEPGQPIGIFLSAFKRRYQAGSERERPLIDRLTLHAEKLRLKKMDQTEVELIAPMPKDFRAVLNMLTKYSS